MELGRTSNFLPVTEVLEDALTVSLVKSLNIMNLLQCVLFLYVYMRTFHINLLAHHHYSNRNVQIGMAIKKCTSLWEDGVGCLGKALLVRISTNYPQTVVGS